jgi:hypothetical protein
LHYHFVFDCLTYAVRGNNDLQVKALTMPVKQYGGFYSMVIVMPTHFTNGVWLPKDVDEEYSESHWIFIMVFVQCEVILFAAPMIALLQDVSTDGRYIGYVLLVWTFPMSTLLLIIGPKVLAFRRAQAESSGQRKRPTRASTVGGVHVSGISGVHASGTGTSALTASGDITKATAAPHDSHSSHAEEQQPRCPVDRSHFAEPVDDVKPPADLSASNE